MSRSLSYLRRGFLGIAVAVSLGFGASTAFAKADTTARKPPVCPPGTESCGMYGECVEYGTCPWW